MQTANRHEKLKRIVATTLWISLLLSILYAALRIVTAPTTLENETEGIRLKSDYVLILIQCLLGITVMSLPGLLERKWRIVLPNTIVILYFVFLYCAIFLGEVFSFYYRIPHWDAMLHAFSGAMLGALGFILVDFLNRDLHVKVSLSPFFLALFAFSFAVMIGVLWEIYEFSFDALLALNMQKHSTASGIPLVGTSALHDTMSDLCIDTLSALSISIVGGIMARKRKDENQ